MVAEEVMVILSGGAPWGFRLQGGAEQQKPLQVAKVRKRSKACRAGLREADELVSINDMPCKDLSHAQAMSLIDSGRGTLHLRVKRAPCGFQSVVLVGRSPSPRIDKEYRAALRALSPPLASKPPYGHRGVMSPTAGPECLTSPPDSEAYYGETDSDADMVAQERHRRQKRRSPSSSPAKTPSRASPEEEEEASEMSGYESAPDTGVYAHSQSWFMSDSALERLTSQQQQQQQQQQQGPPGVARREVVYQPTQAEWSAQAEISSENSDQSPQDGQGAVEVDSGFQEPPTLPPPLVSPERAKEALMLASHRQLVPMVGPVDNPVDEELTVTYKDKAKQAKLHRSESAQDKQVKEARSKCRTIASLLTDAPNPHSKGVLMFKKRRQRAKKYTLTCFGSVDGESSRETEGEEEDDSFFLGSESELDEDAFSGATDPTWDSGYLDVLERRSSACVASSEPTEGSPGLSATSGKGTQLFEQQRKRAEEHTSAPVTPTTNLMPQKQPDMALSATSMTPVMPNSPHMVNGEPALVSRTSIVLSSPGQTPMPPMSFTQSIPAMPTCPTEQSDPASSNSVHNRTARPFAPGCVSHRAATAPVVFKPTTPKKAPPQAHAVSMATIPSPFTPAGSEVKRAISTTSLYIPARPATFSAPPSVFSPTSSAASAPFSPQHSVPAAPFCPATPSATPLSPSSTIQAQPFSPPVAQTMPFNPPPSMAAATPYQTPPPPPASGMPFAPPAPTFAPTYAHAPAHAHAPAPTTAFAPVSATAAAPGHTHAPVPPASNIQPNASHKVSFNPYISVATTAPGPTVSAPLAQQSYPLANSTEGLSSREQRISVPASRTGILQEARRRGTKKPMFSQQEEKKTNSPNPELLSLVQNLDERPRSGPGTGLEAGFESGPEEDSLNLGAEACNFMQAQRSRMPPPVAPKPVNTASEIPQMGGKGAELFARRQNRMDRYIVEKQPKSPAQPREPSPTPSLPAHWKYSPNIRAPPPINYNPLLSPSCPPVAQRGTKMNEAARVKTAGGPHKQGIKALDYMSRQPYQLNSSLFTYGGGVPQTISTNQQQQQQNGPSMMGSSLNPPKQVPVKAARVYEIKRFSTPTPMSAPTALTPTVIVPRSATSLGESLWRSDVVSPPPVPVTPVAPAPFSPPPPAPTSALPALPKISTAPVPNAAPIPMPAPVQAYTPFQAAKEFKSAPELSPLSQSGSHSAVYGSNQSLRVPRPRFSTSSMGLQPNVWRPGSMLY
ncbi:synaptopodin 2-like protein [Chanos chanos]|uniref:Synaptopodin 2-like protein n=1 Tax=Chanos chanos TaxID=29144 RepID=A0A6J2VID4_CHACN|nr:synaptopodin 2-like protein [Chanos chanos]